MRSIRATLLAVAVVAVLGGIVFDAVRASEPEKTRSPKLAPPVTATVTIPEPHGYETLEVAVKQVPNGTRRACGETGKRPAGVVVVRAQSSASASSACADGGTVYQELLAMDTPGPALDAELESYIAENPVHGLSQLLRIGTPRSLAQQLDQQWSAQHKPSGP